MIGESFKSSLVDQPEILVGAMANRALEDSRLRYDSGLFKIFTRPPQIEINKFEDGLRSYADNLIANIREIAITHQSVKENFDPNNWELKDDLRKTQLSRREISVLKDTLKTAQFRVSDLAYTEIEADGESPIDQLRALDEKARQTSWTVGREHVAMELAKMSSKFHASTEFNHDEGTTHRVAQRAVLAMLKKMMNQDSAKQQSHIAYANDWIKTMHYHADEDQHANARHLNESELRDELAIEIGELALITTAKSDLTIGGPDTAINQLEIVQLLTSYFSEILDLNKNDLVNSMTLVNVGYEMGQVIAMWHNLRQPNGTKQSAQ